MSALPVRSGSPPGPDLAVDFGTAATKAVLRWSDGRTEALLFAGVPTLSSAVYATGKMLLVGAAATSRALTEPAGYQPNPKLRLAGQPGGPAGIAVPDLIIAVLHQVWQAALTASWDAPTTVTLTHPHDWPAAAAETLLAAARSAGMPQPRLVSDPVAAATYAVTRHGLPLPPGASLVICDHGAGGWTASVVRRENTGYTVLSQRTLAAAGGLALDERILTELGSGATGIDPAELERLVRPVTDTDRLAALIVRDRVRTARESLADPAGDPEVTIPALGVRVTLGRDRLEAIIRPVLEEAVATTRSAVRAAGLSEAALAPLLLVGGCAQLPLVARLLAGRFGIEPVRPADGVLAQAIGAGAVPPVAARWATPAAEPAQRSNPWAPPAPEGWDGTGPWDRPGVWDRGTPPSPGTPSPAPVAPAPPAPPAAVSPASAGPEDRPTHPLAAAPPTPRSPAPPPSAPLPSAPLPSAPPPSAPPPSAPLPSAPPPSAPPSTVDSTAPQETAELPQFAGDPSASRQRGRASWTTGAAQETPELPQFAGNPPAGGQRGRGPWTTGPAGGPGPDPFGQPGTGEHRQLPADQFGGRHVPPAPAWPEIGGPGPRRRGRGRIVVSAGCVLVLAVAATALVLLHPWSATGPTPVPTPVGLPSPGARSTATVSWSTGDNSGPVVVAGARQGGALTVLDVTAIGHLDPTLVSNPDERAVAQLVYRSLTAVRTNPDGSGTVIGDLATHPGLDVRHDCTVWRYTLRDGVRYADGTPVRAQDVTYSVARSFNPAATGSDILQRWLGGNSYRNSYDGVHAPGVSTPDDHTIEFTFPAPHCDMPYAASLPTTAPVPVGADATGYDRRPPATGPYQVTSFDSGGLALGRNPAWNAATDPLRLAGPDTVAVRFGVTQETAAARLGADAGDDRSAVSFTANARGDAAMIAATAARDSAGPGNAPLYLLFNLARLTDLTVRQAIAQAVGKAAVIAARGVPSAVSTPLSSITDPAHAGYAPYPDPYPRDVPKAKTLLGGRQLTVTLAISTNGSRVRQAEAIRQALAEIGVTVTVSQVSDPAGLRSTLSRPDANWDLALLSTGPAWPTSYRQLLNLVDGRDGRVSLVNDAAVNARLDELDKLPINEQNAQAVQLDRKILTELCPLLPLYVDEAHYLHGSLVNQVPISASSNLPDLNTAYLSGP